MNSEQSVEGNASGPTKSWQGTDLNALLEINKEPWVDENDIQTKCVVNGLSGIILAGFCYPFVICMLVAIFVFFMDFTLVFENFFEGLQTIFIISLLGGSFGAIISTISGLLAILMVLVVNRSLGNPLNARSATISAGSLAGYIPMAWVFFVPQFSSNIEGAAAVGFLGPALAMLLGAFGAAWTSKGNSGIDLAQVYQRPKHRLSIRHMMIATAWVALVFATANYFGGQWFVIAVAAWLGMQTLMLYLIWLFRRFRNSSEGPRPRKSIETD